MALKFLITFFFFLLEI